MKSSLNGLGGKRPDDKLAPDLNDPDQTVALRHHDHDNPPFVGNLVEHDAEVLDISQTGLSLLTRQVPPGNGDLWIGIRGSLSRARFRVILKSLSEPELGRFLLRLAFADTCPYDLFKCAVLQPREASAATPN